MFRAHEPERERLVAVKVFRLDITPEQAAALVREFEQLIARTPGHPAIVKPIGAGLDGSAPYLAMEYAVGDSLDVFVRDRGPMPVPQAAAIAREIAAAIDACADVGIHHGLLHPRDVIVSGDSPKVTGFGIADALTAIGLRLQPRRPYAPAEGASDIYALAGITYELISGRRMTPTGWDELSAEDGPQLRDAFAAALSPDPNARPRTAGEFVEMIGGPQNLGGSQATRPTENVGRVLMDPASDPAPEPAFDTLALDRFAEPGVDADLQSEFVDPPLPPEPPAPEPPAVEAPPADPFPPSWSAQPPRAIHRAFGSVEPASGPNWLAMGAIVAVVGLILGVGGVLLTRPKKIEPPKPPVAAAQPQPGVNSTTVDLPPPSSAAATPPAAPVEVPAEPSLPAPTPSRPASGAEIAPARPTKAVRNGRVLIRTSPAGATITVNGTTRGKSPLAVRDLALGSYTIHVARDGFAAVDRTIRLTARRPSASLDIPLRSARAATPPVSATSAGSLSVDSRPSGARVFVNGRLVGTTPFVLPGLPAGPTTVRIEKDGYQPWATTVRVGGGAQTRVAASLDRR